MTLSLELAAMAGLLALSAFFAAGETSLFSLRPWRIDRLRQQQPARGAAIAGLLDDPLRLLVTIVVGAELVTIIAGNLSAVMRREWLDGLGRAGIVVALGATSGLFVLFGEITPKAVAANFPEWTAAQVARPLAVARRLLSPLALPLSFLASRFRVGSRGDRPAALTEADFRVLVDVGMQEGVLNRREVDMIGAVFRLDDLPVRALMVPRPDVLALPASSTVQEALAHIRGHRHSRLPVYDRDLDHIVGILYAKDILAAGMDPAVPGEVRALARPAFFVPEMMRARQLLREFQTRRLHMAVVVDEYGGTSGLASLEDLLEEIVGDIADDYDRPILLHRQIRRGLDWARGSLPFTDFKKRFRARAKAGGYDTLGGYVLSLAGRIPVEGERVSDGQYAYVILRTGRRRIEELMIERLPDPEKKRPGSPPGAHGAL